MATNVEELEKRVEEIERVLQTLLPTRTVTKRSKDWRRTIGIFADDPVMAEIFDRGREIREAEREDARRQ